MTDNITLPRATVQQALDALERTNSEPGSMAYTREAKASVALEDALCSAPQQQAEPVAGNTLLKTFLASAKEAGVTHLQQAEPIGWLDRTDMFAGFRHRDFKAAYDKRGSATPRDFTIPVYTAPPQQQAEPVNNRIYECAKRLVEYADFKLGGILSADSSAKDIPSNAVSHVKSRHLAALRNSLYTTAPQHPSIKEGT